MLIHSDLLISFFFFDCVHNLVYSISAKDELTVHVEANASGQVGFHVFEIDGCARVQAVVCALDRLQDQDTPLTDVRLPLEVKKDRLVYNRQEANDRKAGGTCPYVFRKVEFRLRVSVRLALHGNGVAFLDWISVGERKSCFLRGI